LGSEWPQVAFCAAIPKIAQFRLTPFPSTNTLIVAEIERSVAFYRDVLGATVLREGAPAFLRLGNIWLIINGGGGPTDDKPEVVASPPRDPNVLSIFLNLRVTDIRRYYRGPRTARFSRAGVVRPLVFAGREIHHRT
jgi:catechol 2,3-dioxygenase-like lactoylglutathione lyase family enzyme